MTGEIKNLQFAEGTSVATPTSISTDESQNYAGTNSNADSGVGDWVTYADAAASTPVDGSGGSPTVTLGLETSSPLRGTQSFKVTKDAADRQGEGVSLDLDAFADPDQNSKILSIELEYLASANFATGDMGIYVYDITNTTLITPEIVDIPATTNARKLSVSWVSAASSSYRLVFHVATTNALAYTLTFDSVVVKRGLNIYRNIDWTTPTHDTADFTGAWNGAGDVTGGMVDAYKYSVVNNTMHLIFRVLTADVTGGNTELRIKIPGGFTPKGNHTVIHQYRDNGGARVIGTGAALNGETFIRLTKIDPTTNWAASTGGTEVRGDVTFEVN